MAATALKLVQQCCSSTQPARWYTVYQVPQPDEPTFGTLQLHSKEQERCQQPCARGDSEPVSDPDLLHGDISPACHHPDVTEIGAGWTGRPLPWLATMLSTRAQQHMPCVRHAHAEGVTSCCWPWHSKALCAPRVHCTIIAQHVPPNHRQHVCITVQLSA